MGKRRRAKFLRGADVPAKTWHWINLDVERVVAATEKALQVKVDGGRVVWLPRSQIVGSERFGVGDVCLNLSITEWIAKQKGL